MPSFWLLHLSAIGLFSISLIKFFADSLLDYQIKVGVSEWEMVSVSEIKHVFNSLS
jgi:hypothetical protein